jgi:hypothetical protein
MRMSVPPSLLFESMTLTVLIRFKAKKKTRPRGKSTIVVVHTAPERHRRPRTSIYFVCVTRRKWLASAVVVTSSVPIVPTGRGLEIVEIPPDGCPNGHRLGARQVVVTFLPWGRGWPATGHRSYRCRACDTILYVPEHTDETLAAAYQPDER